MEAEILALVPGTERRRKKKDQTNGDGGLDLVGVALS